MPFRQLTLIAIVAGLASPASTELSLRSQAAGLDIVAIDNLPAAPQDQGDSEFCSHLFVETVSTPGGQHAAAKGWHVTAELAFGDLTAVSFVGSAEPATRAAPARCKTATSASIPAPGMSRLSTAPSPTSC